MIRVASFYHELFWLINVDWTMVSLSREKADVITLRDWLHKNCRSDVVIWEGHVMPTVTSGMQNYLALKELTAADVESFYFYFKDRDEATLFKLVLG
jgi:hypothetical protein